MKEVTSSNFGLLITYLLPGFVALWGVGEHSQTVRTWLTVAPTDAPTIGGFLYVTLASLAAGLTVSAVRWAMIDSIHAWTGLRQPQWDFSKLQENLAAFQLLHELHYRYYKFYGAMCVAVAFTYISTRFVHDVRIDSSLWFDGGVLLLEILLFAGSRDTLRRYYDRVSALLGTRTPDDDVLAGDD